MLSLHGGFFGLILLKPGHVANCRCDNFMTDEPAARAVRSLVERDRLGEPA
jgi:hypothetical protein